MKKNITMLITLLVVFGLLAGCGGGTNAPASSVAPSSNSVAPQQSTSESAAVVNEKPYEGTELTFLRHSGYDADWMSEKALSFYEKTGIKVTVEQVAYSEMRSKFVLDASSSGGMYDMFATTDYWLPEFDEGGWIVDLNPYLNDPALVDPDFDLADVSQNMLDVDSINGKLMAFPWKFNSQFLCYRTDLISSAPTSWTELLSTAQSSNSADVSGIALALSKSSAMDIFLNILYQNGGTLLADDLSASKLDSAEALEAMQYLVELAKYSGDGSINSHWDEAATVFSQGRAAMAVSINTQIGNIRDPEKSNVIDSFATVVLPGNPNSAAAASTWGICVTSNCEKPEAAFLYIQYLNRPDQIRELVAATNGGTVPVRSSLLTDPEFAAAYPHFDVMNEIATTPGYSYSYPKTPQSSAIMEILAGHVQNAVLGSDTAEGALAKAKSEIDALL